MLKYIVKKIVQKIGLKVIVIEKRFISLKPEGECKGNVLLSYVINGFYLKKDDPILDTHPYYWETIQVANTFLELGYAVDVIHYLNETFMPTKKYSFFIDCRWNMKRLAECVGKECIKIFHVDICNTLFNDVAELTRLLNLQRRRGVTLQERRVERLNQGIEYADCATVIGNKFTLETFEYAGKPMYTLPVISLTDRVWPEKKDFDVCRKNFLWLGSRALVHKGLDLVLEAFAMMPDYTLTICGPIDKEEDFVAEYHKELYETPNIHTIGWMDVTSAKFEEISSSCIGFVYASAGEGQSSSVATALSMALIPIVSYECGWDVEDFGTLLDESSVNEIKQAVQRISKLPEKELKRMARSGWEYAKANHTKEKYAEVFRSSVNEIIKRFTK